jgi:glycosyltransferase involved in cell wall biosynthesis
MSEKNSWYFYDGQNLPTSLLNSSITVITAGKDENKVLFIPNFVKVLNEVVSGDIVVICEDPDEVLSLKENRCQGFDATNVSRLKNSSRFSKIANYLLSELRISIFLLSQKRTDFYIFFLAQTLTLPVLTLKLMGKKPILVLGSSNCKVNKSKKSFSLKMLVIEERINFFLAKKIVLYSGNLIKDWDLERYQKKIIIGHRHYIQFENFSIIKPFSQRECLIGYIGRLSEEKGILNFITALPGILKQNNNLKILIIGEGPLKNQIQLYLHQLGIHNNVTLTGWITHNELPKYLNMLRLVIVPSDTEGLSNTVLESMACGTPVLATPVGALPDFIKDEHTGFIMENNSPECIRQNVIRAINSPDSEKIIANALNLLKREFTFDSAVKRYSGILKKSIQTKI